MTSPRTTQVQTVLTVTQRKMLRRAATHQDGARIRGPGAWQTHAALLELGLVTPGRLYCFATKEGRALVAQWVEEDMRRG